MATSSDGPAMALALIRARRSLTGTVRHDLADAGFDDVPRTGALYLGALGHDPRPFSELTAALGVPKQVASQVIDRLVVRGYALRVIDPVDRRRVCVSLTPRGVAAAEVCREAVDARVSALARQVGHDRLDTALTVLRALADPADESERT